MAESTPDDEGRGPKPAEAVGDSLRAAVERTLSATAGSATGTRQRAQDLLDDVVRRGQAARDEVTRRSEGATSRIADAIGELRAADDADMAALTRRIDDLEARLAAVEQASPPAAPATGQTKLPEAAPNPEPKPETSPRKSHDDGISGP